jgi:hypothetical protein
LRLRLPTLDMPHPVPTRVPASSARDVSRPRSPGAQSDQRGEAIGDGPDIT